MAELLTASEVAALTGLDERVIRKEVEHGFFGERSPPRFAEHALVYFTALAALEFQLALADRRRLFDRILDAFKHHRAKVELGPYVQFDLGKAKTDIENRLERFFDWKNRRTRRASGILGGEPVFQDTRLAVRNIGGMLLRGAKPSELKEEYPYLSDEDVHFARLYTIAYPRLGRPRAESAPR